MKNIKEILKKYNQEHLLMFYDELTSEEQKELIADIETIDFDTMNSLKNIKETVSGTDEIAPVRAVQRENYSKQQLEDLKLRGRMIIESGSYAILTMAGGQGTRLGHSGPKGTFSLSLKDKDRYIFEIFIDYLKQAKNKYGVYLNWYIMTSKDNNDQTIEFFEGHNYFGYPKDKIKFFIQGELPITDMDGNLLLESKSKVLKAADGNGGVFNAVSKVLKDMKEQDIKWVLITGIDNILVNIADELYIGLVDRDNKLNGVKSVAKSSPEEKVGVFCKRNGKPSVIEYSEMNEEMKYAKDENGELKYMESNIVNHLLGIELLEKIQNEKLPIHKAIKKMSYIDKDGNMQNPTEPCLIKYEAFIFDYFNKVEDVTILRVERDKEFAPVKNKEGQDSPETATELYNNLYFKEV
ncbi:MAG: UTP--glucose-1-phosphate uridylyltransferase [Clostridia bacterium]|nr:UTP--glucose-1-phosphate uridylyltransferase [Clostridia bacterium]